MPSIRALAALTCCATLTLLTGCINATPAADAQRKSAPPPPLSSMQSATSAEDHLDRLREMPFDDVEAVFAGLLENSRVQPMPTSDARHDHLMTAFDMPPVSQELWHIFGTTEEQAQEHLVSRHIRDVRIDASDDTRPAWIAVYAAPGLMGAGPDGVGDVDPATAQLMPRDPVSAAVSVVDAQTGVALLLVSEVVEATELNARLNTLPRRTPTP